MAAFAGRNIAVDAYRGFVMLLLLAEVLHLKAVHDAVPQSLSWRILAYNQTHVPWAGLSLHDMIQPSFTFLVGVALPYSIQSRIKKGQAFGSMLRHTLRRSLVLVVLGILLRSTHSTQTNFTFEDTLTQIGLGYTFAFLISFLKPSRQWICFGALLSFYWLLWALYPAPPTALDLTSLGVPPDWHYNYSGLAAHWNKNTNLGTAFDVWFLNLFPRASPFRYNRGGYATLSFIPTLGTMLLGLFAGQILRKDAPRVPIQKFLLFAAGLTIGGLLLHFTGICPIVKRIWTPSWVLLSGGICFLFIVSFSWLIDLRGNRRMAFPLVVIGTNSIAAYLMASLCDDFLTRNIYINFGSAVFTIFGHAYETLLSGTVVLAIYWLVLYWMWRNKIFLRI
ncbi:MAG: DUF5009 domain-containing protein [Acidobacteria bacterium]|nr:DUF5009 domain-containing protein [Acidobacteriota bacterium]